MSNGDKMNSGSLITLKRTLIFLVPVTLVVCIGFYVMKEYSRMSLAGFDVPSATVLEMTIPVPAFSLTNQHGDGFSEADLQGKWTFIFFGYTYCPVICPTALVDLNGVYNNLEEKGDDIKSQVIFVSVDPKRDTVERLKEYIPVFNDSFVGLTGTQEMITSLSRKMGIAARRAENGADDSDYEVEHTASILLVDPLGGMRAIFTQPHDPDDMTRDFRKIFKHYSELMTSGKQSGLQR